MLGLLNNLMNFPYGIDGFGPTASKTKFQIGDEVYINNDGRWNIYQSKKSTEAIDQIAEIVGYKYVPGAYSKYAVKLPNQNIYAIHSHFLKRLTDEEIQNRLKIKKMIEKLPEFEGIF